MVTEVSWATDCKLVNWVSLARCYQNQPLIAVLRIKRPLKQREERTGWSDITLATNDHCEQRGTIRSNRAQMRSPQEPKQTLKTPNLVSGLSSEILASRMTTSKWRFVKRNAFIMTLCFVKDKIGALLTNRRIPIDFNKRICSSTNSATSPDIWRTCTCQPQQKLNKNETKESDRTKRHWIRTLETDVLIILWLSLLFNHVTEEGRIPSDCQERTIVSIWKRQGDSATECLNYCLIWLLSHLICLLYHSMS